MAKASHLRDFLEEVSLCITTKRNPSQLAILFSSHKVHDTRHHQISQIITELKTVLNFHPEEGTVTYFTDNDTEGCWNEICSLNMRVLLNVDSLAWEAAFNEQVALLQAFQRILMTSSKWLLPTLYQINNDLWHFALLANSTECQQECARSINKSLTICLTDRSPINESRKWGVFKCVTLLFRIYFHLGQLNLCNNVLKALGAAELPGLERYPVSDIVSYRYFLGRYYFVNEEYVKAENEFSLALGQCPHNSIHNKRLILHFLIPLKILQGVIPSMELLTRYKLDCTPGFYSSAITCIRLGDIKTFTTLLESFETGLLQLGTFLLWEKLILVVQRSLLRRIFLLNNSNTRIPLAILVNPLYSYVDEVACIVANLIDRGLVKGYISQEKSMIVLSQKDPFPSISTCRLIN